MSYNHHIDAETVIVIQREMKSLQEALMYRRCVVEEFERSLSLKVMCPESNVGLVIQCRPLGERDATGPMLWYNLIHEIKGIPTRASQWWQIPELIDRICANANLIRSLELCAMDANDAYDELFSDQTRNWIHPSVTMFSHVDAVPKNETGYLWLLRRVSGGNQEKDTPRTNTSQTPTTPTKLSESKCDIYPSRTPRATTSCSTAMIDLDSRVRKAFENRVLIDGLGWFQTDLPMKAESNKRFHPKCGQCSTVPNEFVHRVYEWKWKDIKLTRTWMCVSCFDHMDEHARIQYAYRVFRYHIDSNLVALS
jgi:hypothetical protein